MNTKRFYRFASVLLVLIMLISVMPMSFADEISFDGSTKMYVDLGAVSWWQDGNAVQKAYFYGTGEAWADLSPCDGNIYEMTVPAGTWTNVILVRCNPAGTGSSNWDNKWNQTDGIPLESGKNYLKSFADNSSSGTWGNYPEQSTLEGRDFDGEEFLYVNVLAESWWNNDSAVHRLKLQTTEDATVYVTLSQIESKSTSELVYGAAIPAGSYVKVMIERVAPDLSQVWNHTGNLTIPAEGNYISAFSNNCSDSGVTWTTYVPGETPDPGTAGTPDNYVILHCWNWSYDTIRQHLSEIKAAGYNAVQTSPAQPTLPFNSNITVGDWWRLYQPMGFHIAPTQGSWLGGAAELTNLCSAAEALDIKVIVDVVANHVANGWDSLYQQGRDQGMTDEEAIAYAETPLPGGGKLFEITPNAALGTYNPELYDSANPRLYFRDWLQCNDNNTENTVRGNIGMPDLKTENTVVQNSVIAYLKELIDCGVDGFRFDAAKHIETPSDDAFASDFWPNVIGAAKDYAEENNVEIWSYGEVLSTAGKTRKMNYYAPYIDMTDITYAFVVLQGFGNNSGADSFATKPYKDWLGVGAENLDPADLVLMAESHDMYTTSGDSSSRYSVEDVNKAWAMVAARANASALYFARPDHAEQNNANDPNGWYPVGTMGACESFDWKDLEVVEANKFHTAFVGAQENVLASNNFVVVERYNADDYGAVIINALDTAANLTVVVPNAADGTYYDQITGNQFVVSNHTVSGEMGSTGIVILRKTEPSTCEHPVDQRYTVTKAPTCTEEGYEAVFCGVCGRQVSITTTPATGHVDSDHDMYCDVCHTYLGVITVYYVDTLDWVPKNDNFTNVNYYAFGDNASTGAWPGAAAERIGTSVDEHGIWKTELNPEAYQYVKFIGHPAEEGEVKTVNLAFKSDAEAAERDYVVYASVDTTEQSDTGPEYCCDPVQDLSAICAHTGYHYVTEDGVNKKICDCCGTVLETDGPIQRDELQLKRTFTIDIEMRVNYYMKTSVVEPYESYWVEVTLDGTTTKFGEDCELPLVFESTKNRYYAYFSKIDATDMGKEIKARLYAKDASGQVYYGPELTDTFSSALVETMRNTGLNQNLRKIAANMLIYGGEAQRTFAPDTVPVDEALSQTDATLLENLRTKGTPELTQTNSSIPDGSGVTLKTTVSLQSRVELSLTVKYLQNAENVKILVKDGQGNLITTLDTTKSGSAYKAIYNEIGTAGIHKQFIFKTQATIDGETVEIGNDLIWSLEGFTKEKQGSNARMYAMCIATLKYCDSIDAYMQSIAQQ